MRAQRPPGAARCLAADAGSLPFPGQSFDAAMSVLSDLHWPDPIAGLQEMRRVARRVVVFQFDTTRPAEFWLIRDYLPEFTALARGPTLTQRAEAIGARMEPIPIPWDCADGFFHAYWRRPAGPGIAGARAAGRINRILSAVRGFLRHGVVTGEVPAAVLAMLYDITDDRHLPAEVRGEAAGLR